MSAAEVHAAGDTIPLAVAAAIYAERDLRADENVRNAELRARARINDAIKRGTLRPVTEGVKVFRRDFFVAWARSNEPNRGNIKWAGPFARMRWSERFEGLYEAGPPRVQSFKYSCDFIYSRDTLLGPVLVPSVDAPREWREALEFSIWQNDALRNKIAELEGEIRHLKLAAAGAKGGRSRGL